MNATQKYLTDRLAAMRQSRQQFITSLQQIDAKREELAAHINAHNGGIAELERLAASFTGEDNGQDQHKGTSRRLDGQGEQDARRVDEAAEVPVG